MKGIVLVVLLFSLVALTSGLGELKVSSLGPVPSHFPLKRVGADPAWCPTCVSFMADAVDDLINIIAQEGIGGGCSAVCAFLPIVPLIPVCIVVCEIVGIIAFADLINDIDPDPIWLCMEVDVCPINDNASAEILSVTVTPSSGPQGTTFDITTIYRVNNTIATGEVEFVIVPPDAMPFGTGALLVEQAPGLYKVDLKFQANPSENEPFNPGTYKAAVAVCEGSCGSIHSHSFVLSEKVSQFVITQ